MSHLIFNSESNWNTAKAVIDAAYSCPYRDDDYFMDRWDIGNKHISEDKWQICKPEDRQNATSVSVMAALNASEIFYIEAEILPEGWFPIVEEGV